MQGLQHLCCTVLYCAVQGLQHLSSRGIVHRDLALRNVLLTAAKAAKIADFGLAAAVGGVQYSTVQYSTVCVQVGGDGEYWSAREVATPYKWGAPECLADQVARGHYSGVAYCDRAGVQRPVRRVEPRRDGVGDVQPGPAAAPRPRHPRAAAAEPAGGGAAPRGQSLELQTNHRRSFHNHGEGSY